MKLPAHSEFHVQLLHYGREDNPNPSNVFAVQQLKACNDKLIMMIIPQGTRNAMFPSREVVVKDENVYSLKTSTLHCPSQRWHHPSS